MFPDIEPSAKQKYCACEGISGELKRWETKGKKKAISKRPKIQCPSNAMRWGTKRKGQKYTHKEIGKKKCPLELVPTKAGTGAPTLLAEKVPLDTVVVFVSFSWHTSLTTAKGLTPSATFRTKVKTFAAILETIVKDGV